MFRPAPLVRAIVALLVFAGCAPQESAAAQALSQRVNAAPDGEVRFTFPTRAGICGDGRSIIAEPALSSRGVTVWTAGGVNFTNIGDNSNTLGDCHAGPGYAVIPVRDHTPVMVRPYVGGAPAASGPSVSLGNVTGADAQAYFLSLVSKLGARNGRDLMLAAYIADGGPIADRFASIASDRKVMEQVREQALRFVVTAARHENSTVATTIARRIAEDATESLAMRERAVKVLGEEGGDVAWLEGLYRRVDHLDLRERILRVIGEQGGERSAGFVRAIALDERQPRQIRERAIRLIGEEMGRGDELRDMYAKITDTELRDRIVRIAGDDGVPGASTWLRSLIEDESTPRDIRDRAIRSLGERGETTMLRAIYPKLQDSDLRDRALRVLAEVGDASARTFVRSVIMDATERLEVRDRALRLAAEGGTDSQDLAGWYDRIQESSLRGRLVRLLGERGDRAALDKLASIARTDNDREMRRLAGKLLASSGDPRAAEILKSIVAP